MVRISSAANQIKALSGFSQLETKSRSASISYKTENIIFSGLFHLKRWRLHIFYAIIIHLVQGIIQKIYRNAIKTINIRETVKHVRHLRN